MGLVKTITGISFSLGYPSTIARTSPLISVSPGPHQTELNHIPFPPRRLSLKPRKWRNISPPCIALDWAKALNGLSAGRANSTSLSQLSTSGISMPENLNLADSIVSMLECLDIWTATLVKLVEKRCLGRLCSRQLNLELSPKCRHSAPTPARYPCVLHDFAHGQLDVGTHRVAPCKRSKYPRFVRGVG